MRIAVCSGSFDPITLGHMDIIRRTAACFDQVYVCVSPNAEKRGQMFTPEQKLKLVEAAVLELPNVTAELYGGLLADFAAPKAGEAAADLGCGGHCPGHPDPERFRYGVSAGHGEPGSASGAGNAAAACGPGVHLFELHRGKGDDPLSSAP